MRSGLAALLISLALILAAVAIPAAAQSNRPTGQPTGGPRPPGPPSDAPQAKKLLKYYLHEKPCGTRSLDLKDSAGDDDACFVTEPAVDPIEHVYATSEPFGHVVRQAFQGKWSIFVTTEYADDVQLTVQIAVGPAVCQGFFFRPPMDSNPESSDDEVTAKGEYAEFTQPCFFNAEGGANAKPTVTLRVDRHLSHAIGYEGDHASFVEIGAEDVEIFNNTRNETEPPTPARDSSLFGLPLLLGSLALLVAAWRRRE